MNYSSSYYQPGQKDGFNLGESGSAWLQIVSVTLNTVAVFLVALSLLGHLESDWLYLGGGILALSAIGIMVSKAWPLMVYVSRVLVGGLFVVSGMIKANDPEGFSYKLHDYFQENALDMEWLNDYAVYLAIVIAVGEIVLGFAAIVGGKMRLTSWTLLLMILFFSWLTFYTSTCLEKQDTYGEINVLVGSSDRSLESNDPQDIIDSKHKYDYVDELISELGGQYQDSLSVGFDEKKAWANKISEELEAVKQNRSIEDLSEAEKAELDSIVVKYNAEIKSFISSNSIPAFWRQCVDDCGCFGDAMKGSVGRSLTPWESFAKDAVLLYFVLIIFFSQGRIRLNTSREDVWMIGGSLLVMLFLCWVFGWYFTLLFSLALFAVYIFMKRMSFGKIGAEWMFALLVTAAATFVAVFAYTYLPLKDYRPYAEGMDLRVMLDNGTEPKKETTYIRMHRETGDTAHFSSDYYNEHWKEIEADYLYLNTFERELDPGKPASILDFAASSHYGQLPEYIVQHPSVKDQLFNEENNPVYKILYMPEYESNDTVELVIYDQFKEDYPDSVYVDKGNYQKQPDSQTHVELKNFLFSYEKVMLIVSRELDKARHEDQQALNEMAQAAMDDGVAVVCLTSTDPSKWEAYRERYKIPYPFATADGTELKIVVRSNPGIVLIQNEGNFLPNEPSKEGSSMVMGKWSSRNLPDYQEIKGLLSE